MVQIENEYGSYGNDRTICGKEIWTENGIDVPFSGDGPAVHMLSRYTSGLCSGLDSGRSPEDFELAGKINPGVPVSAAKHIPDGLLIGVRNGQGPIPDLMREVKYLMDNKKSFNLYVIHGGTNFGFTAGANSGGKGYEPDITSYDYDAPIDERGKATPKYMALRKLIGSYLEKGSKLPDIPAPVNSFDIPPISVGVFTSVWDNLPEPVRSVQPQPLEAYNQDYGFILYKTKLIGHKSGTLKVTELHDYATIFLDGNS